MVSRKREDGTAQLATDMILRQDDAHTFIMFKVAFLAEHD
jgi:hypothetical protein